MSRLRLLLAFTLMVVPFAPPTARAAPRSTAKKTNTARYWWQLGEPQPKSAVDAELAVYLQPLIEDELAKAVARRAEITRDAPANAPTTRIEDQEKWLRAAKLSGAHRVSVDIVEASEALEPSPLHPGQQRLVVRLSVHVLGENTVAQTLAFSGDGGGTVKQDIGKHLRPADREFTWRSIAAMAFDKAIATSLDKLRATPANAAKSRKKR